MTLAGLGARALSAIKLTIVRNIICDKPGFARKQISLIQQGVLFFVSHSLFSFNSPVIPCSLKDSHAVEVEYLAYKMSNQPVFKVIRIFLVKFLNVVGRVEILYYMIVLKQ